MDNASYLTDQPFTDLDLAPELIRGLETAGFSHCTQIQQQALPLALAGKDVAGQAQTGTGKSAAFLLAIFNRLLRQSPHIEHGTKSIRAVVLAPTRELAIQIHRDATQLCKYTALRTGLVYGGTGYQDQTEALGHGVDILIGTPGRFIDFYKQGLFDLKAVQVLVLDEADRMFDLGFIRDIRYVLRRMPPPDERLNMLFSATMSRRVEELAYEHMNDPISIKIESETPVADQLIEEVYYPANEEKLGLLVGLLKKLAGERVLIFCNMRGTTEKIGRLLNRQKYSVGVLSGDVPQKKRERLLTEFTLGRLQMLVATDVAARGLHIPSVSHVFNFDLPQDPEDYVHRIGRTARAGASGHAISFACEDHAFSLIDIESFIGHTLNKQEILPQDIAPLKTSHRDKVGKPRRKIEPPIPNRTPDASTRGSAQRPSANVVKTSVSENPSVGETSPLATNESRTAAEAAPSTAPYALTKPSGKSPFPRRRASEVPAVG